MRRNLITLLVFTRVAFADVSAPGDRQPAQVERRGSLTFIGVDDFGNSAFFIVGMGYVGLHVVVFDPSGDWVVSESSSAFGTGGGVYPAWDEWLRRVDIDWYRGVPTVLAAIRAERMWRFPTLTTPVRRLDKRHRFVARGSLNGKWVSHKNTRYVPPGEVDEIGTEIAIYEEPHAKVRFVAVYERKGGDTTSGPVAWVLVPTDIAIEVAPVAR